jgi:hypothetical protein
MNDFDYDVLQKKRIARNAKYQKNGRKSHKCTLPSDHLTEAQKRKLNGEIMTYQLNKPVTWKEFRRYPTDIQVKYLEHFANEHKCNRPMMAEMFDVSLNNLNMYIGRNKELTGILARKASTHDIVRFHNWLKAQKEDPEAEPAIEVTHEERIPVEEVTEEDAEKPNATLPDMPYTNTIIAGQLRVSGRAMDISQTLYRMFKDMPIKAVISFEVDDGA